MRDSSLLMLLRFSRAPQTLPPFCSLQPHHSLSRRGSFLGPAESSAAAPRQAGYNYDSEAGRRQQGAVTSAALGGGVHGGQPGMAYMQDPVWGVYEVSSGAIR